MPPDEFGRAFGEGLNDERRRLRRRGHSPIIVNGRPADLQPLPLLDPLAWDGAPIPERKWIVSDLIPEANVTLLGGDGGLGKSQLALQLMVACVLGRDWLGLPAQRCKVLGVFCEDDEEELHRRLDAIATHYGASLADLEDLALIERVDQDNLLMEYPSQWESGQTTAFYQRLETAMTAHGAKLVILDSLHDFFGGNENSRPHARQFITSLRSLVLETRGAIVLTAHPSLSGRNTGTGEAGSTAWNNAVRSRLYLTAPQRDDEGPTDRDYRELKTMKANYSAAGSVIRLRWREGVFEPESSARPLGIVENLQLDNDLVEGLRELIKNGARVPADPKARKGFANAVRELPSCKRYAWGLVCAAQARLIDKGRIVRVEHGPPSRRFVYLRPNDMIYPGEANAIP
jgi:RecA-family ATPase